MQSVCSAPPLKLPLVGACDSTSGSLHILGTGGDYWSGSVDNFWFGIIDDLYALFLEFNSSSANIWNHGRATGLIGIATKKWTIS